MRRISAARAQAVAGWRAASTYAPACTPWTRRMWKRRLRAPRRGSPRSSPSSTTTTATSRGGSTASVRSCTRSPAAIRASSGAMRRPSRRPAPRWPFRNRAGWPWRRPRPAAACKSGRRSPSSSPCHGSPSARRTATCCTSRKDCSAWMKRAGSGSRLSTGSMPGSQPETGPGDVFLTRTTEGHPQHPRSIWEHTKAYTRSAVARSAGVEAELDSARQAKGILADRLQPGESVLDVGCGAGHLWRSLADLRVEYHGIDAHRRAIEIGRLTLADTGLPPSRLRTLAIEDLPPDERYDAVVSLSTLLYAPDFRLPLEAMARAARRVLVVRSSFGERTDVRYLPDVLLEPGFEKLNAYFSIFARGDVEDFLRTEGFRVEWIEDVRQRERFGGEPEVVGGIPLPYEFLVAERV
ncbi:MAG: class I SAM-dependent methyltransferase [Actinobacteria bacterium]|nr:MAG: class I SAM-dependent methyltransferase [Actinomycetota bacterium]